MSRPAPYRPDDGSIEHYALLFTPQEEREDAAAILGFARAMRELSAVQRDVAPIKVRWWHDELARFEHGDARHPLCQALAGARSDALAQALAALLHGAVMDINEVTVTAATLDEYLRLRSGALHEALAAAAGRAPTAEHLRHAGTLCGLADLLREARDPAHADRPAVRIELDGVSNADTAALEAPLRERVAAAAAAVAPGSGASVTGAVLIGLYKAWWPRIMATPYGQTATPLGPWRKLWTAWRSARASSARGNEQ